MSLIPNDKLKKLVIKFSDFINISADLIIEFNKSDGSGCFLDNWLQANWEMIVEHFVCQENNKLILLKKYGEGADDLDFSLLDGQSYYLRVSLPSMRPTHKIMCLPINDNLKCHSSHKLINFPIDGLEFKQLTSTNNKGEYIGYLPSFDKVLLSEKSEGYVDEPTNEYPLESIALIDDLIFTLVETVPIMDYYVDE